MRKIIISLLWLLLTDCYSQEKYIPQSTNFAEFAIYEAITDFADNCRLFKQDSIFYITTLDTLKHYTLQRNQGTLEWICDSIYANLFVINIIPSINKLFYLPDAVVGSKGKLPSRYVIVKGKLFYWRDRDYPLTEEMLSVLKKYNVLTDMIYDGMLPEYSINDAQKGASYYFCRNDLSKYKRVVTNIATEYYSPPKLKCGN